MREKPTLFLSYRRDPSGHLARSIYDRLTALGVEVFFDAESINAGRFAEIIEKEIIKSDYFLVILTPITLDSEWVRREIQTALKHRRNIIPLMDQGFSFSQPLPNEIKELADYSGIPYDFKAPYPAIEQIKKAIGIDRQRSLWNIFWSVEGKPTVVGWLTIISVILAFSGITLNSLLKNSNSTPINLPASTSTSLIAIAPSSTPNSPTEIQSSILDPSPTKTPSFTMTPESATIGVPTTSPTIDAPQTIIAATSFANAQATSAIATVYQYFTQTASVNTNTPTTTPTNSPTNPPTKTLTTTANPAPTATSELKSINGYTLTIETDPNSGYVFAVVPAGPFSDIRGTADKEFRIGVYEVTNVQFAAFVNARGFENTHREKYFNDKSAGTQIQLAQGRWRANQGLDDYPMIEVTWYGARDYCAWIGARLPTSTEWHKASNWNPLTTETMPYPWGSEPLSSSRVNISGANGGTAAVNSYKDGRSSVGAYNLLGNVWEWVSDSSGVNGTRSGGAWDTSPQQIGSDITIITTAASSFANTGFRCAR